jgi:hypothetical protein
MENHPIRIQLLGFDLSSAQQGLQEDFNI